MVKIMSEAHRGKRNFPKNLGRIRAGGISKKRPQIIRYVGIGPKLGGKKPGDMINKT
tara:strand:+ start:3002 stop:3172 length:171 start_codon:yes stop_codon:yes gene_type:complete